MKVVEARAKCKRAEVSEFRLSAKTRRSLRQEFNAEAQRRKKNMGKGTR